MARIFCWKRALSAWPTCWKPCPRTGLTGPRWALKPPLKKSRSIAAFFTTRTSSTPVCASTIRKAKKASCSCRREKQIQESRSRKKGEGTEKTDPYLTSFLFILIVSYLCPYFVIPAKAGIQELSKEGCIFEFHTGQPGFAFFVPNYLSVV